MGLRVDEGPEPNDGDEAEVGCSSPNQIYQKHGGFMWKQFVRFVRNQFRRTGRSATDVSSNDSSRASGAPRTVTGGIKQLAEEMGVPPASQSINEDEWIKMLRDICSQPYKGRWAYLGGKWYQRTAAGNWICDGREPE